MPKKPGPWDLNEVKSRLRQEQVERERAASLRYRQQKERDQDGHRGESRCLRFFVLLVLALSCFLLAASVVFFSRLVFFLVQKLDERKSNDTFQSAAGGTRYR